MYEKFGQFIDGKWDHSSDKSTYEVINPANEEVLGYASKATSKDVDKALQSAKAGYSVLGGLLCLARCPYDNIANWQVPVGTPFLEPQL